ncbi:MAG: alpha/beta hydrolase, partial [Bacteroidales bacterium]|nr:alpha/beta hydrolase [Bacteroidales bacterium]
MKRIIFWSASLLLAANCLTGCLAGKFMSNYALKPAQHGEADIERTRAKADSLAPGVIAWYDDLHAKGIFKDITRTDEEGYKLHAVYAPAKDPETAQGTAVVVHGYTDNHLVFMYLVRMYRDEFNYNVMVPDLQFFGYSEGAAAQMGWLDRLDVEEWAKIAHDIFKNDFTVVHGVSMGAAATMMMSGDELPPY